MIRDTWEFSGRAVGHRVFVYATTDSTNDRAAEHAGQPGLAVLADEQTAGRGQHGRTWDSRPGASVLLSVLLAPPPKLARPAILTAWAAVSVCETVRRLTGVVPRIKWPNDVYLHRKKVAGILIEQGRPDAVVAGIGLNVRQTAEDFAELPLATSLRLAGADVETEAVARLLLEVLDAVYAKLLAGDVKALETGWKRCLGLVGLEVAMECRDATHYGHLSDVGFDMVILERPGMPPLMVPPEAVLHLSERAEGTAPGG